MHNFSCQKWQRSAPCVSQLVKNIIALLMSGVATLLISLCTDVAAQSYPSKPIRIVTAETGGGADFLSRLVAQGLSAGLGQQVVVDNRPSGVIPAEVTAQSAADGYTLLFYSNGLWTLPLLQKVPYDPVRDLVAITLAGRAPNILVVHPSLPARSVHELIALANGRPGELNYGSAGNGSSIHLAAEMFKSMAGVNIVSIPYKGGGPAIIALLGGQIHLIFAAAGSVGTHIKSGRLRALAVTSAQPSRLYPDLPTIAMTLSGYESIGRYGMFAPAKTPPSIIARLNQETIRALNLPEIKERAFAVGVEIVASSSEEFAAIIKSDMNLLSRIIKNGGMRTE